LSGRQEGGALHKGAMIVNGDVTLAAYFQSMLTYFTGTAKSYPIAACRPSNATSASTTISRPASGYRKSGWITRPCC